MTASRSSERRGKAGAIASLDRAALARLMPMHLVLSPRGRVREVGPTMDRLFAHNRLKGRSLFSLFEVRGPGRVTGMAGLAARAGQKLQLRLRGNTADVPRLGLRGLAVPLADGSGFLVNLSFGVDIVPAVGLLQLSDGDFAPTDMAMELLYLAEANAIVMREMRAQSERLDGKRLQAEEEALTDPLTGLRNRRACDSLLARLCREGMPFAVLNIDLDHFKRVNDTYGHAAGDLVLAHVAGILKAIMAEGDFIARVGGDEFVAILPGRAGPSRLDALGAAIVAAAARPVSFEGNPVTISASVGAMTVAEGDCPDPARVLAQADAALYAAKEAGRGRIMLADPPPRDGAAPADSGRPPPCAPAAARAERVPP